MDPNQQNPNNQPQPTPQSPYDPNYLDSIAPSAQAPSFFSGTFGKVFFILIGVFVLAVSLIVAFSGKDDTSRLEQLSVRLENLARTSKTTHKSLRSNNLSTINSVYRTWLNSNQIKAEELLDLGGVKKTDYSKEMTSSEKQRAIDMDKKFNDARLNAQINRVYASTMTIETEMLSNMFNAMAKKNKSSKIKDFAKEALESLKPIHDRFDKYVDDGN